TQVLDGNGALIGTPSACGYGAGAPYGLGLVELLRTSTPPPFNDDLNDFDWAAPGRLRLLCVLLSLGPGSPTLKPGMNPLLPSGAEPADILVSCPGIAPYSQPQLFIGASA